MDELQRCLYPGHNIPCVFHVHLIALLIMLFQLFVSVYHKPLPQKLSKQQVHFNNVLFPQHPAYTVVAKLNIFCYLCHPWISWILFSPFDFPSSPSFLYHLPFSFPVLYCLLFPSSVPPLVVLVPVFSSSFPRLSPLFHSLPLVPSSSLLL